ncbi:hypothetical protein JHK82_042882 [Glycine max]|nr:hypothetical protein JHK85_043528 [Glycine max]KAG5105912.1 hypothetical protein JHK82_042882 [Glycine max]KAG5116987.1 hypothetical protein JHK84_043100 [Glycine max]
MEGANNINQVRGDSFEKKDKSIENSNMIGKTVGLGLHVEDSELKELCLIEIEKLLNSNGRSLKDYIVICHVQIVLNSTKSTMPMEFSLTDQHVVAISTSSVGNGI